MASRLCDLAYASLRFYSGASMRHALIVLIILLGSTPAFALWGPFGGLTRLKADKTGLPRLIGYEAGILTLAADRSSLWHLAYIKVKTDPDNASPRGTSLEQYQARMSVRLLKLDLLVPYIGAGAGLGWFSRGGTRRQLLITEAHLGLLLSPADVGLGLWEALPCLSCLKNSSDPKCRECMAKRSDANMPQFSRYEKEPSWLQVGIEAGYRSTKMSLSGFEGRLYAAILF